MLNRKLSIVFFSDIVGYTLLMGQNEDFAFELMKQNSEIHTQVLLQYNGKIIKELGDGILAVFESSEEALAASLEIQKIWKNSSDLKLRIGLHGGEVIFDHGDVFGDAVNIASRIQSIGVPSSVIFSTEVLNKVPANAVFTHVKLGPFRLKNVKKELELYALTNAPLATPKRAEMLKNVKTQERQPWKFWVSLAATISILIFLIYSLVWNDFTWEKDRSVAVLPFENIDTKSSQDLYSKEFTQEVINQLSEINDIKVISYMSVKDIPNSEIDLDSLARVLKVSTILRGSIQYLEDKTRVDVQLIDIEENKNIWTESFIRNGADVLKIQSAIAKEISRILGISLSAKEEAEIGKVITSSPKAFDWFIKAKEEYSYYDPEHFIASAEYFKKAIDIDPNFTAAYAGLSDVYAQLPANGSPLTWYDSSLAISAAGLQIDPNNAELYKSRGNLYYNKGQLDNARRSFETALTLKPNYSQAIGNLATINFSQGMLAAAIEGQKKSASLNPNNPIPYETLGWIYKILNQDEEALAWFTKALEIGNSPNTYSLMATLYLSQHKIKECEDLLSKTLAVGNFESAGLISFFSGRLDDAQEYYEKSILAYDGFESDYFFIVPINYSFLLLKSGQKEIADSLLDNAIKIREKEVLKGQEDYNIRLDLAAAMAVKHQDREALEYLQGAFELGWRDLFFVEFNPIFLSLKKNPTYLNIIEQVKEKIEEEKRLLTTAPPLNRQQ